MKKVLLAGMMFALVMGCTDMVKYEEPVTKGVDMAGQYAPMVDPITKGWASTVMGIVGTLVSAAFAVNRALLAKKLKDVIVEVNYEPSTPKVVEQVQTAKARSTATQALS